MGREYAVEKCPVEGHWKEKGNSWILVMERKNPNEVP